VRAFSLPFAISREKKAKHKQTHTGNFVSNKARMKIKEERKIYREVLYVIENVIVTSLSRENPRPCIVNLLFDYYI
jgi:hypothetical protein